MTAIQSRKPTGRVPYPLILLEGEEKAGKTYAAALLSRSEHVGTMYWFDIAEGAGDEYGAIPGVDYEIVEWGGDWHRLLAQLEAVREEARRAQQAGEPPVVVVIDTLTAIWESLKDWTTERAARTEKNRAKLRANPDVEVDVSTNFWNDANARHRKLMNLLMTFPGIAVVTAHGKETVRMENGRPVSGQADYSVECQKRVPSQVTLWVRMFRNRKPLVIGARSVHAGIVPGKDEPQPIPGDHDDDLLEFLAFTALRVDPATAHVRQVQTVEQGELSRDERADEKAAVAEENRKLAALKVEVWHAQQAIGIDSKAKAEDDYRTRNAAELADADVDQLLAYLSDLRAKHAAMGSDATGAPA